MGQLTLLCLVVLVVPLIQYVQGDAVISVRFKQYINAKGVGANGHCCDGKWGICQSNGCDHKFTVCMGNYTSSNKTKEKHCPLGFFQSGQIKNQNNNTFTTTIANLRNPLLFNVTGRLPDGISLKVDVYDSDKGTSISDHVDLIIYRAATKLNSKYVLNLPGTTGAKTMLYAEMIIQCVNKTVGQRCEAKAPRCKPPGPRDHYKCEKYSGNKICTDGYMGKNCDLPPRGTPTGPARPSGPSRPNSFPGPAPGPAPGSRPSPGSVPARPSGGASVPGIPSPGGGRPAPAPALPSPSGGGPARPPACPPPRPGDHYTCDPRTGAKVCNGGYTGRNCDIPPSSSSFPSSSGASRPTFPSYIARKADCDRIAELEREYRGASGVFNIQPSGVSRPFPVYCVMTTDERGWTQIQRREENGLTDFNRNWRDYKAGFGEVGRHGEGWIGLENLHALTSQRSYKLRIDIMGDDHRWRHAIYDRFSVDGERDNYRLHVSGYDRSSTAGDALQGSGSTMHNGMSFSTPDRDNDRDRKTHCAQKFESGWWFNACFFSNLNGPKRLLGGCDKYHGKCISWYANKRNTVLASRMAILPN